MKNVCSIEKLFSGPACGALLCSVREPVMSRQSGPQAGPLNSFSCNHRFLRALSYLADPTGTAPSSKACRAGTARRATQLAGSARLTRNFSYS